MLAIRVICNLEEGPIVADELVSRATVSCKERLGPSDGTLLVGVMVEMLDGMGELEGTFVGLKVGFLLGAVEGAEDFVGVPLGSRLLVGLKLGALLGREDGTDETDGLELGV